MPILQSKNGKVGLIFGSGDIEVSPGLAVNDYTVGVMSFNEKEPGAVGDTHVFSPPSRPDPETFPVQLIFTKTESIDVLIRNLERVKRYMEQGDIDYK